MCDENTVLLGLTSRSELTRHIIAIFERTRMPSLLSLCRVSLESLLLPCKIVFGNHSFNCVTWLKSYHTSKINKWGKLAQLVQLLWKQPSIFFFCGCNQRSPWCSMVLASLVLLGLPLVVPVLICRPPILPVITLPVCLLLLRHHKTTSGWESESRNSWHMTI